MRPRAVVVAENSCANRGRRCPSLRTITWSRSWRRMVPITRSAKGFCQGDWCAFGTRHTGRRRERARGTLPARFVQGLPVVQSRDLALAKDSSPIPPRSARLATNEEEEGVATEHLLSALVPRPHQRADQDRLALAQRAQREVQPADGDRYPGRDAFSRFEAPGAA